VTATLAVGGPKLTDWFMPEVKPVHVGVYQTCESEIWARTWANHGYQYWDGKHWGMCNTNPEMAAAEARHHSPHQVNYWRGLAEQPAA